MTSAEHAAILQREKASAELAQALKPRESLYDITSEVSELLELAATGETEEVREAAKGALEAYRETLPNKVDSMRGWIKHCAMMEACAAQEAREQKERAEMWKARGDRAKDYTKGVMEGFGIAKMSGRTGEFTVRANPPAVEITESGLLEYNYYKATVSISGKTWMMLGDFMGRFWSVIQTLAPEFAMRWEDWRLTTTGGVVFTPDKAAIAAALNAPCPACKGDGAGKTTESGIESCNECCGSGKASVPGARLTQGSHLRVS